MIKKSVFIISLILLLANPVVSAAESAPDFELNTLDNRTVILSSHKGNKKVLLVFWTTWCPFCRDQLDIINDKHQELAEEGVEVLAINAGESSAKVKRFLADKNVPYNILLDEDHSVARLYKVIGVPTYILIDKDGQIVFKDNSFPEQR